MKLYVGNLSYTTTEETLRELFSNYGEVISVIIMKDKFTGQSKGFGFVEMSDETYERGIGGTNGKNIDGRRLRVTEAVEKSDNGARKFFKERHDGRDGDRRERRKFGGRDGEKKSRHGRGDRENRRGGFHGADERSGGRKSFDRRDGGKPFDSAKNDDRKNEECIPDNEF